MAYAENTSVPADRTRGEIEKLVQKYGAHEFASGWTAERAVVLFTMRERRIRFNLPMPDLNDKKFVKTATGQPRTATAAKQMFDQEIRRLWRALLLSVKAKLEAVESGIAEFDQEFMAQIVMPDGLTVGEHMIPKIVRALENKKMPPMLALPGAD